jgi:hypothetical protein
MKRISLKRITQLIVITLVLFLCFGAGYFTVFRAVDSSICIPRVSKKLGIRADVNQVYQYVKDQLTPGMKKTEVMDRLGKIGEITIKGTTELANGSIREGVELRICSHPLNNILILNSYSKDWTLLGAYIVEDSP